MVLISEWLPNPAGSDVSGEWVELFNNGNAALDLSGWRLQTKSGNKAVLGGEIGPGGYAVFYRSKTKLVLRNSDESLFLYDAGGKETDKSSFPGTAPEGKSFSRLINGPSFTWSDPTPGTQNKISLDMSVIKNVYPTGVALNHPQGAEGITLLALGVGAIFTAIILFLIKRNENLFKLLFGGD